VIYSTTPTLFDLDLLCALLKMDGGVGLLICLLLSIGAIVV
jgi:hypothetical protein